MCSKKNMCSGIGPQLQDQADSGESEEDEHNHCIDRVQGAIQEVSISNAYIGRPSYVEKNSPILVRGFNEYMNDEIVTPDVGCRHPDADTQQEPIPPTGSKDVDVPQNEIFPDVGCRHPEPTGSKDVDVPQNTNTNRVDNGILNLNQVSVPLIQGIHATNEVMNPFDPDHVLPRTGMPCGRSIGEPSDDDCLGDVGVGDNAGIEDDDDSKYFDDPRITIAPHSMKY